MYAGVMKKYPSRTEVDQRHSYIQWALESLQLMPTKYQSWIDSYNGVSLFRNHLVEESWKHQLKAVERDCWRQWGANIFQERSPPLPWWLAKNFDDKREINGWVTEGKSTKWCNTRQSSGIWDIFIFLHRLSFQEARLNNHAELELVFFPFRH